MKRWPRSIGVLAAAVLWAGFPSSAHALEVRCSNDNGACTVANTPEDFLSCLCTDESGTGGTGFDDWADLSEQELLDICEAELKLCDPGPGTTTTSTGPQTTSMSGGGSATTAGTTRGGADDEGSSDDGDDSSSSEGGIADRGCAVGRTSEPWPLVMAFALIAVFARRRD